MCHVFRARKLLVWCAVGVLVYDAQQAAVLLSPVLAGCTAGVALTACDEECTSHIHVYTVGHVIPCSYDYV